ncbi:MAG: hypothetical protein AWU57_217 [Marinobacter sp. T13-3]|nr:MAG: hypothetical protein AWU57_217 [Marinobacter sp. T13-3]
MATPLTIRYEETAFTLPWSHNRQDIHDQVYQVVLDGKNVPQHQKTRLFLYDAMPLDADAELGLVTARAPAFGPHIESASNKLTVRPGDTLTLNLTVSATRKVRVDNGKREQIVIDDDVPEWIGHLLARHAGVTVDDAVLVSRQNYTVRKPKMAFRVPVVKVRAVATVQDAPAFAKAFLNGVGRQKGYGTGLIEVVAT